VNGLSYVADAAAVLASIAAVRWSRGHLDIHHKPLRRGLAVAAAVLIGCLCYFLVGFALSLAQPAHQADLLIELRQTFPTGVKLILGASLAANAFCHFHARRQAAPIEPIESGVRQRLLRARADIERRIESVHASPVLDYRGGVPQTDLIVEGLRERLSEIDDALSRLEPTDPLQIPEARRSS